MTRAEQPGMWTIPAFIRRILHYIILGNKGLRQGGRLYWESRSYLSARLISDKVGYVPWYHTPVGNYIDNWLGWFLGGNCHRCGYPFFLHDRRRFVPSREGAVHYQCLTFSDFAQTNPYKANADMPATTKAEPMP